MIPVFDISRAIEWIKNAAADVIKYLALKALLIALIYTLLPIALYKGWLIIQEKVLGYLSANVGGFQSTMLQYTGIAGWLADQLRFAECFTVLISGLTARFIFSFFRR